MAWTEWMGIVTAVAGGAFAWLKFRQAQKVDAVSAQSGVASNHRAGTEQVIEGLNKLIDQLQEENEKLRTEADGRATRLEAMTIEVARLRRRYGNGDDTPLPPSKTSP